MPDKPKQYRVEILSAYCKGCGLCIDACPKGKIAQDRNPSRTGVLQVHVEADAECSGCGLCATVCPDAAIEIYRLRPDNKEAAGAAGDSEE